MYKSAVKVISLRLKALLRPVYHKDQDIDITASDQNQADKTTRPAVNTVTSVDQ